ncbi:MAG: S8 family serine peptidase [Bacteroidia bacterium]
MKRILIIIFLAFEFSKCLTAQTTTKYWVKLTDKNGSPYSVSNPSAFLTPRAINRRTTQNIAITTSDLPVNPAYISQIQGTGALVLKTSRWLNAVVIDAPNATILAAVNNLPCVQSSTPVARHRRSPDPIEKATDLKISTSKITGTNSYNYGGSLNQISMLNGVCMHDQGYDGKNMLIAVLDAGFLNANTLAVFDSLWINNQILGTRDFVVGDTMVFEDFNHGSSVLSCMGGNIPGQLVGTAPKAKYWLLRTEDANSELIIEEDNWVRGAEFADSVGADLINSSLGYTTFDISSQNHTYSDLTGKVSVASIAATMAARKGMIVCNSAGNDGGGPWQFVGVPADADSILAVGSVDAMGNYSSFSSTGPTADGRIKPDVAAKGSGTTVASAFSGNIITSSGTSFSSPVTCGMVSCLWQANPGKTNMEIITAIKQSASQYQTPDNNLGYGIPNFCKADSILKGFLKITKYSLDDLILLSPNPFSDELSFAWLPSTNQDITYEVFDMSGRLLITGQHSIKQKSGLEVHIKGVDALAKGMYIFVATTSTTRFTKKIIKD